MTEQPAFGTPPAPRPETRLSLAIKALPLIVGAALAVVGMAHMAMASRAERFDPAKPVAFTDPTPAILKHLEAMPRGAPSSAVAAELEQIVAASRAAAPQRVDEVTTLANAHLVGSHVGYDYRITLPRRIDDLVAFREGARKRLTDFAAKEYCAGMTPDILETLTRNAITTTHAYTLNDGKETMFIDLAPGVCAGRATG